MNIIEKSRSTMRITKIYFLTRIEIDLFQQFVVFINFYHGTSDFCPFFWIINSLYVKTSYTTENKGYQRFLSNVVSLKRLCL